MAAPSAVKMGLPPFVISFQRLFARASGEHVEPLHRAEKSQRGVDVALRKMKAKSTGGRCRARLSTPSATSIATSVTRTSQAAGSATSQELIHGKLKGRKSVHDRARKGGNAIRTVSHTR